jgi:hypothetical protein
MQTSVGAAAGCDLLILTLKKTGSKDRSLRQLLQGTAKLLMRPSHAQQQ